MPGVGVTCGRKKALRAAAVCALRLSCGTRAAGLLVALLLAACGRPAAPAGTEAAPSPEGLLEVQAARLVGTDAQGRVRWELRASSVAVDRRQRVTAQRPAGYLTAEDGTRVRVEAERAVYARGESRVELVGRARVVAAQDRWAVAERMAYEPAKGLLVATGGVTLRADGWTVTAPRLVSEPALRRARLEGGVRVSLEGSR